MSPYNTIIHSSSPLQPFYDGDMYSHTRHMPHAMLGTCHISHTIHYTTLHYNTLHYTTPHYTTLHYNLFHKTTLHIIKLQRKWDCKIFAKVGQNNGLKKISDEKCCNTTSFYFLVGRSL